MYLPLAFEQKCPHSNLVWLLFQEDSFPQLLHLLVCENKISPWQEQQELAEEIWFHLAAMSDLTATTQYKKYSYKITHVLEFLCLLLLLEEDRYTTISLFYFFLNCGDTIYFHNTFNMRREEKGSQKTQKFGSVTKRAEKGQNTTILQEGDKSNVSNISPSIPVYIQ